MKIAVITSPFGALPPDAIGAMERLWTDLAKSWAGEEESDSVERVVVRRHIIQLIGKKGPTILPDSDCLARTYVNGYERTGNIYCDIILDFVYTIRALRQVVPCDVLVVNTFWGPIVAPIFFRKKYLRLVYNVARFPKRHLRLYTHVDLLACTSNVVKSKLHEIAPNLNVKRIVVVNNPIDVTAFNGRVPLTDRETFLIGYHGRIHREKGLHLLAKAVAKCADAIPRIRIRMIGAWDVGKGGGGDAYKKELDALSGNRIDWVGAVTDRGCLASMLRECLVYCYPSIAENGETFGVSPLEAMGLGLPVIVSNLECFTDFVVDGKNAIVFDHRCQDPSEMLAGCLRSLISSPEHRSAIGGAAAETAAKFSTKAIAEKYISVFNGILKR